MNCWYFDHSKGRTAKRINLLTAALATDELAVPIGVEFICKSIKNRCSDTLVCRRSPVTKNELFRQLVQQCWHNTRFDYVAADSWFSGTENMDFIKNTLHREFVMAALISYVNWKNLKSQQSFCLKNTTMGRGYTRPCTAKYEQVIHIPGIYAYLTA